ncbi:hypothetical protein A3B42_00480 [Candidatus Daviesbacteria bacterium RIFCSPLOWO2_01_FULL_38_10]|uniref:Uncharacterized protein n=1 Tax=Candidatus Daviesbacteria bacterium GW2011_GWF2_38_6 TaxID=1618432 RepID=A0A0G0NJH9_9BACT|nr:MAG: hypothetical protein US99_C0044G0002 [Candidatus Daviesbacteria bacterium GW2011_GWF2_38_6]OGE25692.1 MAG: hypothetical protein A3D02_00035 [Candidatus Daviesbacteria bacterium RIFCSPHIGHO2_02_FULL_39_41]OGE39416.1 MAG: hypothetical protein A3B42_00480 [Candidatus Daviesbacteria bacterium RIFCSPLOWO2_01_FULL_38_10]OGE44225.1 MAG: hypothetical protein A3E67_05010 [Candidatus Daviesbacteria bacterium RIFCSPHIGHO2_12_FULL_38_25]OGE68404.1 MAG: hypothetical protein A3H81_02610 [Candidatus D
MKKKKNRLPEFKTLKEEAEFWDTHSFADFWDELEDVDIVVELEKPRDETIVLRVQKQVKDNLDKFARSLGLNLSTLARMWLMEKLQENLRKVKI